MIDLNGLVIFAAVVEAGSFSAAARRLEMPLSTVSRRVADLEAQLGVRLIERSTRSLRLTDIGAEVLDHAQRGGEVGEAVASLVSDQQAEASGSLRLSVPPSISDSFLAPLIADFQADHPGVQVQVMVTDRMVDHISEGVDIAFRVGRQADSALITSRVLHYRHQLVASPDYLARCTPPREPEDLHEHPLLAFSFWTQERDWTFVKGEESRLIRFRPHVAMNDYAGLAAVLMRGGGIGDLPPICVPELMASGRLVEVMPDWRFRSLDLSMVQLSNRLEPRAVRLFKAVVRKKAAGLFGALPA